MAKSHTITLNDRTFAGRRGDLLLDAAIKGGIDMPYDCRAGHCGKCCVRLVSGRVHGGEGAEPGIIHACQSRLIGDAVVELGKAPDMRLVEGTVSALRRVAPDVVQVGIQANRAFPYMAGQYAKVRFSGYPGRPYSLTHPVQRGPERGSVWLHVRRVEDGRVSSALGKKIAVGHRVTLSGPFGSAYFRPDMDRRLILVSTGTGFAPIWAIASAALHENPERKIMVVAGARKIDDLYMVPVLGLLARFPNVRVIPVCSTPQTKSKSVRLGRPTDVLPRLHPSDIIYACGAPPMVDAIREIAARTGTMCYADPFMPTSDEQDEGVLARALNWLPTESARQLIAIGSRQKRQLALPRPQRSQVRAAG